MGLKSALQALITAFTDGGNNTASEFRTQQTELLNNGYGYDADSHTSQTYTNKNGSISITYRIYFIKSFGKITIDVEIQNTGSSNIPNNTTAWDWKSDVGFFVNEYACGETPDIFRGKLNHDINTLPSVFARINQTGFVLPQGLVAGAKYYGQFTYPAKN